VLFGDTHAFIVPSAALKVDAADQGTILGHLNVKSTLLCLLHVENLLLVVRRVLLVDEMELEMQSINLDLILARVVLEDSCEEALREEEAREPEDCGRFLIDDPLLKSLDP